MHNCVQQSLRSLLVLSLACGCTSPVLHAPPESDGEPPIAQEAEARTDDEVAIVKTASEVARLLQADEDAFDAEYKGKLFELSGEATMFTRSLSSGEWRFKLNGEIPVTFREGNPWHVIVPGQGVTVRARWETTAAGFMHGEIIDRGDDLAGLFSAEEICKTYAEEPAAAASLPHWLVVSGKVAATSSSEQPLYLHLAGFSDSRVECVFDKSEEPGAKSLQTGDQVTVVGTSFGKNSEGDITLADCHLRKPQAHAP